MRDDPGIRQCVIERRFLNYILMVTIVLPRVVFTGTLSDGAAVLLVWSAIGLAFTRVRAYRIPRAIIWRPRETRLRRWGDALLERLGRVPIAYGVRSTIPWDPRLVEPTRASRNRLLETSRDLSEDLSVRSSRTI